MGLWGGGLASNLQGLASNTIWRETIQFAGIREGREGQMRNRSRKINRSEVTDKGLDLLPVQTEKKKAGSEQLQNAVREKHSSLKLSPEPDWLDKDFVVMIKT